MPQQSNSVTVYKGDRSIEVEPDALDEATSKGWSRTPPGEPKPGSSRDPQKGSATARVGEPPKTSGIGQIAGVPLGMAKTIAGPIADLSTPEQSTRGLLTQAIGGPGATVASKLGPMTVPDPGAAGIGELLLGPGGPAMTHVAKGIADKPGELVDWTNIKKDWHEGRQGEAIGRASGQALLWGSMLGEGIFMLPRMAEMAKAGELGTFFTEGTKGVQAMRGAKALDEVTTIGSKAVKVNPEAMDAANAMTATQEGLLEHASQKIDSKLGSKILNFYEGKLKGAANLQHLQDKLSRAERILNSVERAAGSKVGAVADAKDIVARISARLEETGGIMSWKDARQIYKELNTNINSMGGVSNQAMGALHDLKDIFDTGLRSAAKGSKLGRAYADLMDKWATLYNWRRGAAKILSQKDPAALMTKLAPDVGAGQKMTGAGFVAAGGGAALGGHPMVGGAMAGMGAERMMGGGRAAMAAVQATGRVQKMKILTSAIEMGQKMGMTREEVLGIFKGMGATDVKALETPRMGAAGAATAAGAAGAGIRSGVAGGGGGGGGF